MQAIKDVGLRCFNPRALSCRPFSKAKLIREMGLRLKGRDKHGNPAQEDESHTVSIDDPLGT